MGSLADKDNEPKLPPLPKPPGINTHELTRAAGRGAVWQVFGALWQTVIQLGATFVLARALSINDFGIWGMAVLAQGLIGRIGALGTASGVIAKKDVNDDDLSTAFWISAAVQCTLFVVSFAAAPLAAMFFQCPEVTWVMRAIAFTFLFSAAGSMAGTLMRLRLQFGVLKIIESAGFAIQSATAIVLAVVFDLGYWSLVWGILISGLTTAAAGIVYTRWLPRWTFRRESFRFFFRYGINELGTSVTDYFHSNMDSLLIGRILGPIPLGLYGVAKQIPYTVIDRVANPISFVLFPTLAKVQADDERLCAGYVKTAKYIALIVFPALVGLVAVAHPAVAVLWGAKWLGAVVPLQILCVGVAVQAILTPVSSIFLCRNRPDLLFKFGLGTLGFTFLAVGGFGWMFGLTGVAIGRLVSVAPSLVLLVIALRLTHSNPVKLLRALAGPAVATFICGALALAASLAVNSLGGNVVFSLAAGVGAGAAGYFIAMKVFFPNVIADVLNTIRIVIGRRQGA